MNSVIRMDIQTVVQISDSLYYMMKNYERVYNSLTDKEKQLIDDLSNTINKFRKK